MPLIKEELEATEQAGVAHYRKAGEMLIEAKEQLEHGERLGWLEKNFHLSQPTANVYMKLAKHTITTGSSNFKSLNEFRAQELGYKQTVHPTPWHEPVKRAMDDPALMERLKQDTQRRIEESKMARALG